MHIILQRDWDNVVLSFDNALTPAALWLLSCWAVQHPGSAVWPTINAAMSSCLNGLDQTRDERHTMENKGQVGFIRGVGERAVDSRASMTQNQSSVSVQTSQPLSVWGSVMQTRKKERTEKKYSCLFWLDYLLLLFPFPSEGKLKAGCFYGPN